LGTDHNTESVRSRAKECLDAVHPGKELPGWQVEIVQQLRSRLGDIPAHKAFNAAFGEAWEAGQ
jgi:hypothetical protein